jgi:hypothetical protein
LIIVALSHVADPLAWDPDLNAMIVLVVELAVGDVVLVGAVAHAQLQLHRCRHREVARQRAPYHGPGSRRDSLMDAMNEACADRVSADLQLKKQELGRTNEDRDRH